MAAILKNKMAAIFFFFEKNGNINFSTQNTLKYRKCRRSKLTDTPHETFFFNILNLTMCLTLSNWHALLTG